MGYGYDTHSWRNSTEKRQLDQERAELTAKYEAGELDLPEGDYPLLMCNCAQRDYPHELKIHRRLQGEAIGLIKDAAGEWVKKSTVWPWSLKWVELEEYQNAGKAEKRDQVP